MSKRLIIITASLVVVLALAGGVLAYFTTTGSGTASASTGTLTAPGKPNVPTTGATVNLSWSAATVTGGGTVAYHVERRDQPGSTWTDVCGSSDAVPIAATSCSDTPDNGTFVYRVTSRYASWHTTGPESDPVTVVTDTTAPTSSITFPADSGSYNASGWAAGCTAAGICGTASDPGTSPSGLNKVRVSIQRSSDSKYWDGSGWTTSASAVWNDATGTSTWSYALAASNLSNNVVYTVQSQAIDNANNTQSSAAIATFTYDTTNPSASITFPANGGKYNASGWAAGCATAGICGTASDGGTNASGVDKVQVLIIRYTDNKYWNAGTNQWQTSGIWNDATTSDNWAQWSFAFSASNLTDNSGYAANARAIDNAGNTQSPADANDFGYDTTKPVASITFPASLGKYNAAAWSAGCASAGVCGSASDPNLAASGVNKVQVSIQRFSDNRYWDGSSATWVSLLTWNDASGTTNWSYAFSPSNLNDNVQYNVQARATDSAGNTQTALASRTFTYDTAPPTSSITFPAAAAKYNASGWAAGCATAGICGTASDPNSVASGVNKVQVSIQRSSDSNYWNGSSWGGTLAWNDASGTTNWSYAFSGGNLDDGVSYTVQSRAIDNATNTQTTPSTRNFTYDTTPPTVTVNQKAGQADPTSALPILFTVTFSESVTGFDATDLTRTGTSTGGTVAISGSGASYEISVTGTPTNGTIIFSIAASRAVDLAGNNNAASTSTDNSVTYDTSAPGLSTLQMFDIDHNGKVDQVKATFNESLNTSYSAANTVWTLTNAPGGAGNAIATNGVAISGAVATLTLNEGTVNTASGSFTIALTANANGIRDAAGNQSSFAATAVADKAEPVPATMVMTNGNGTPAQGDTISIVFSEKLSVSSICSNWSNDSNNQTLTANNDVTVTITDGGASNDILTVASAACPSLHLGSINLGSTGFVTATRTFSASGSNRSIVDWTVSTLTLKITLGTGNGAVGTVSGSVTSTYTPDSAIKDIATPQNTVLGSATYTAVQF
jgi:hypothetical protein